MSAAPSWDDLGTSVEGHVGVIELRRPPHNFFDLDLLTRLADAVDHLEQDGCRALVLCAAGTAFCAGADFAQAGGSSGLQTPPEGVNPVYAQALRIFGNRRPIVAAVEGPAVGGGLGLALAVDFRIACNEARFSANFTRLGIHPGFGLSVTLPRLVGEQAAAMLFFTGRRVDGREAQAMGLVDVLVSRSEVRRAAMQLAAEIAGSAPLAVEDLRQTLRRDLLVRVEAAVQRESAVQYRHFLTQDFREGVAAMAQRRAPGFKGL
ncbi:MAG TPA: enoyl-CoA hydratase/isomerase family protein [Burkholderiaceae bacterium]|nr:enoyl-CoA hydratase/isomerase family protein [Burkholderiaceae bacterium]